MPRKSRNPVQPPAPSIPLAELQEAMRAEAARAAAQALHPTGPERNCPSCWRRTDSPEIAVDGSPGNCRRCIASGEILPNPNRFLYSKMIGRSSSSYPDILEITGRSFEELKDLDSDQIADLIDISTIELQPSFVTTQDFKKSDGVTMETRYVWGGIQPTAPRPRALTPNERQQQQEIAAAQQAADKARRNAARQREADTLKAQYEAALARVEEN